MTTNNRVANVQSTTFCRPPDGGNEPRGGHFYCALTPDISIAV